MISGRALNRRNVHEKQAIACLRGGGDVALHDVADGRQAFARLVTLARRRGLAIFPPGARFVSDGEIALVSHFAKVGVSRQSVSRLCKDGLVQRIRHGWYRTALHPPRTPSIAPPHP